MVMDDDSRRHAIEYPVMIDRLLSPMARIDEEDVVFLQCLEQGKVDILYERLLERHGLRQSPARLGIDAGDAPFAVDAAGLCRDARAVAAADLDNLLWFVGADHRV